MLLFDLTNNVELNLAIISLAMLQVLLYVNYFSLFFCDKCAVKFIACDE